jgi:DNA-binding HxlR family transcriptional regulator
MVESGATTGWDWRVVDDGVGLLELEAAQAASATAPAVSQVPRQMVEFAMRALSHRDIQVTTWKLPCVLMAKRSYRQYCPMAYALDLLGERWTLLVVRDLLFGPQRYGDLLAGLPGMSTDLLADRLRALESADVIQRRRLTAPAGSTVYELTAVGEELWDVLAPLARWGGRLMDPPVDTDDRLDHRWALLAMAAGYHGSPDRRERYQVIIDDEVFTFGVEDGQARVRRGESSQPTVVVRTDAITFLAIVSGAVTPSAARRRHIIELDGDAAAFDRLIHDAGLALGTVRAPVRTRGSSAGAGPPMGE